MLEEEISESSLSIKINKSRVLVILGLFLVLLLFARLMVIPPFLIGFFGVLYIIVKYTITKTISRHILTKSGTIKEKKYGFSMSGEGIIGKKTINMMDISEVDNVREVSSFNIIPFNIPYIGNVKIESEGNEMIIGKIFYDKIENNIIANKI